MQEIPNAARQTIRFCWLRETAPGHLEHDGGLPVAPSDLFAALLGIHPAQTGEEPTGGMTPKAAITAIATDVEALPKTLRRRMSMILGPMATCEHRAAALEGAAALERTAQKLAAVIGHASGIEVHLPFIDRRTWSRRFEILDATDYVLSQGRVVPTELLEPGQMDRYAAQWLAVASVAPATQVDIAYAHSLTLPLGLVRAFLPVTDEQGEAPKTASREAVTVEIRQTLLSAACRAWNAAPPETSASYFETHSKVSMAVQAAVRRWFAWHWFDHMERFDDLGDAYTVLGYLFCRPCPGRRRTDFTYDVMNADWLQSAFQFSKRPLERVLHVLYHVLSPGDLPLALKYQPEIARKILDRVVTQHRNIRGMIAAEAAVVNHLLKFGLALNGATDAFTTSNLAREYSKGLQAKLRHIFREQETGYLAGVLLIEATNALWVAMGGENAITTRVTLTPSSTHSLERAA